MLGDQGRVKFTRPMASIRRTPRPLKKPVKGASEWPEIAGNRGKSRDSLLRGKGGESVFQPAPGARS